MSASFRGKTKASTSPRRSSGYFDAPVSNQASAQCLISSMYSSPSLVAIMKCPGKTSCPMILSW